MRVLLLGGTGEARSLAAELHQCTDVEVESSLAGRVSNPALPVGKVRIGGFGGVDGLTRLLQEQAFDVVIDATHPFAATITANAVRACQALDLPLLVLRRPGWTATAGDDWHRVADIAEAATAVSALPVERVLLTTGRRDLAAFAADRRHRFVVRTVDPPSGLVPEQMTLLLSRGPYTVSGERQLMSEHRIQAVVTKDSGGQMTVAKLTAARELRLPVIMVDRPPVPPGTETADSVQAAAGWLQARTAAG
jgi:precorrin-6A/cobalt-precorrin-6A reductase